MATVFWTGILGWQAAYTPSEMEKRQCEERGRASNQKTEECKTFWERTTSDPVAFFTFWLVVSTVGLSISTVLLWLAGEKQLRLSSQTAMRQLRAYVTVDSFHIDRTREPDGKIINIIQVKWKNTGLTPTRRLLLSVNWEGFTGALKPEFLFPNSPQILAGLIGPGQIMNAQALPIPNASIDLFCRPPNELFVWGWAEYNDAFAETPRRRTEFCVRMLAAGHVDREDCRFNFAIHGLHNGSDEDCLMPVQTPNPLAFLP
jgi:hypothetical protein